MRVVNLNLQLSFFVLEKTGNPGYSSLRKKTVNSYILRQLSLSRIRCGTIVRVAIRLGFSA